MNILGLIEMHPFDGTEAFVCLRIKNPEGSLFDLPITQEQLSIIASNLNQESQQEEDDSVEEETTYEPTNASFTPRAAPNQEPPLVLNANHYTMGQSVTWDEDDDL